VTTLAEEAAYLAAEANGEDVRQPLVWDPDSCWLLQLLHGPDGAPPGEPIH
jgi:hypothetical protein